MLNKWLCLQALEFLQMGRFFEELAMSKLDTLRALALIAAKMIHPASEQETSRWTKKSSSLPEFPGLTMPRELEPKRSAGLVIVCGSDRQKSRSTCFVESATC